MRHVALGLLPLVLASSAYAGGAPSYKQVAKAASAHDAEKVKAYVAAGYAVDAADPKNGQTVLFSAAVWDDVATATVLLDAGANPDVVDWNGGYTPLTEACLWGSAGVVKALLEHGADSSIATTTGQTCWTMMGSGGGSHADANQMALIQQALTDSIGGGAVGLPAHDDAAQELVPDSRGHTIVRAVAVSPSGQWIATGGDEGDVRLWDRQAQKAGPALEAAGPVYALAFSPDGKWLAVGGDDLRLYDLTTMTAVATAKVRPSTLRFVGDRLYEGGTNDKAAVAFAVPTLEPVAGVSLPCDSVLELELSPDGKRLAIGGDWEKVHVYDVASGQEVLTVPTPGSRSAVAWSPDGTMLAVGTITHQWDAGRVTIVDASTGKEIAHVGTGAVTKLAWGAGGVAAGSMESTPTYVVQLDGKQAHIVAGFTASRYPAWTPDGQLVLGGASTVTRQADAYVVDPARKQFLYRLKGTPKPANGQ